MRVVRKEMQIIVNEDEIDALWNIIAFALELDVKERCMTTNERFIANALYNQLDKSFVEIDTKIEGE